MEIITGKQARERGLKWYFTGKPCKNGHIAKRRVDDWACAACACARVKKWDHANPGRREARVNKWRVDNRDRKNTTDRAWAAANKNKVKASYKKFRATHLEECLNRSRKWIAANRDRMAAYLRNYRAKKRSNGGTHTAEDVALILAAQGGKCTYCCVEITNKNKHIDHIIPISLGGSNSPDNLQVTCRTCNLSKGAKHPDVFAKTILRGS
jgi:5-methylcytosine-specific restriction endonuclease McrA